MYQIHAFLWLRFQCMDNHLLFTHSSNDGDLGYFHFRTIMNNTVMTFKYKFRVNICFHFSWGGITRSCGTSSHPFKELPKYFPKWLHHFTILPAVYKDFSGSFLSRMDLGVRPRYSSFTEYVILGKSFNKSYAFLICKMGIIVSTYLHSRSECYY